MQLRPKTFENGERAGKKGEPGGAESNPGSLAYRANCSATELQLPPATKPMSLGSTPGSSTFLSCSFAIFKGLWM